MNREYAMQWVEALRSGRYQQGKDYLNQNGKFCCLGVACELIKDKLAVQIVEFEDGTATQYNGNLGTMPDAASRILGMRSNSGGSLVCDLTIKIDGFVYLNLIIANDSGVPFSKIADWIEANYESL